MLIAQKEMVGLQAGSRGIGKPRSGVPEKYPTTPTLAEMNIDKKLSSKSQKLAAVKEKKFEEMLGEWKDRIAVENDRVTSGSFKEPLDTVMCGSQKGQHNGI